MGDKKDDATVEATDAISEVGSDETKNSEMSHENEVKTAPVQSYESIPAVHSYQIKPILADKLEKKYSFFKY